MGKSYRKNQIWKEEKLKPVSRAELFRKWVKYLLYIHETEGWDKKKTPEEEAEDDKMIDIWDQVHPVDQLRLWDLSEHLHVVRLDLKDDLPLEDKDEVGEKNLGSLTNGEARAKI